MLPQLAAGSKCRNSNFNSGGWSGSIVEVAATSPIQIKSCYNFSAINKEDTSKCKIIFSGTFPQIMFVSAETHYMVALRVSYWKQRNTKNQRRQKTSIKAKRKDSLYLSFLAQSKGLNSSSVLVGDHFSPHVLQSVTLCYRNNRPCPPLPFHRAIVKSINFWDRPTRIWATAHGGNNLMPDI